MIKAQNLKGFRDFLPGEALKRKYVIQKITEVFELFGYDPLETPALEYSDVLLGKYGEEGDKLMYRFKDNGGRDVALRYDQTVPASRVVAQYPEITKPFKRYQIQTVWRAENTQKGRFREFLQCDADIFGSVSPLSDAEIIRVASSVLDNLKLKNYKILINDRSLFAGLSTSAIITIDKLKKIGKENVKAELISKNLDPNIIDKIENNQPSDFLKEVFNNLDKLGVSNYEFSPTLARGLDYYTSTIMEIEVENSGLGSICGGGRYDKLISLFSGQDMPAVGFAFGFDRLVETLGSLGLLPEKNCSSQVLVTIFSPELLDKSVNAQKNLQGKGINTELYLDPSAKLDKQLKYADSKGIPFVVIIGPDESANNTVQLKNLATKEQKEIKVEEVANYVCPS